MEVATGAAAGATLGDALQAAKIIINIMLVMNTVQRDRFISASLFLSLNFYISAHAPE
jgi:hypothetical protein